MAHVAIPIAIAIGSAVLQALLTPKPKTQRLDDTRVPRATAGSPIFWVWGTVRLDAIRVWSVPLTEEIVDAGGKNLFAGRQEQAVYFASYADLYCRGPVTAFLRLWFNSKIKYDIRSGSSDEVFRTSSEFADDYLRFHLGTSSQNNDSLLETIDGIENAYPYRRRAYLTVESLPVDEFGNSAPTTSAEISANGTAIAVPPITQVKPLEWVDWINLVGAINVIQNELLKTVGSTPGFNVGAISSQLIEGHGGKVIFSVSGGNAAVGLSNTNPDATAASIDYCIIANDISNSFQITENGTVQLSGTYDGGELRIEATPTGIQYFNAGQLIYSSTFNPVYPLFVDASIDTLLASVSARVMPVENVSPTLTQRIQANPERLSNIVRDLCTQIGGLEENQVNVSELNDIYVPGFTHGDKSARDSLQALAQAFFFEAVETTFGVRWQLMKRPSVAANIPLSDLAAHEGNSNIDSLIKTFVDDALDLPKVVRVRFRNPDLDYDQDEAEYINAAGTTAIVQSYELPIVLQRHTADMAARRLCFLPYIQRFKYEFTLPLKYLYLEPGDVISIPAIGNTTRQVKIESINNTGAFLLGVKAQAYDGSIFDDSPTPDFPPPANSRNTVVAVTPTSAQVLNTPLIRTTDTDLGMYVVANGPSGWIYATLFGSRDGGNNYQSMLALNGSPFGRCLNRLRTADYGYVDRANELTVALDFGTLASTNFESIFTGSNLAFVGNNDRGWEVIAYQNAVLQPTTGVYVLSVLRRGLFGTEQQINRHTPIDFFVPAQGSRRFLLAQDDLGLTGYFKAVSKGQSVDAVTPFTVVYSGRDVIPYAPVVRAIRDVVSGDWAISWHRRDRKASRRITWTTVTASDPNQYRLQVRSGATTIVRTEVISGATNYIYSAANQTTDFGSPQTTLSLAISQANNYGGWGYPGTN